MSTDQLSELTDFLRWGWETLGVSEIVLVRQSSNRGSTDWIPAGDDAGEFNISSSISRRLESNARVAEDCACCEISIRKSGEQYPYDRNLWRDGIAYERNQSIHTNYPRMMLFDICHSVACEERLQRGVAVECRNATCGSASCRRPLFIDPPHHTRPIS